MKRLIIGAGALMFFIVMLGLFFYSARDFATSEKDSKFLSACEKYPIQHSGEFIDFPFGQERHRREITLSDGVTYTVSEKLYEQIIVKGCANNQ